MRFKHCVAFGGVLVFAYGLTAPALTEAIRANQDQPNLTVSSAKHPAFDLPHTHFEFESEPIPKTIVEIAASRARTAAASATIPTENLNWVSASVGIATESLQKRSRSVSPAQ